MARILIIEDNDTNMKLAVRILEHAEHSVLQASDAHEGLRIAREREVDLVLMDVHLPGMDGISAMRMLRSEPRTAGIRTVALTAMAMRGDRERLLDEGFDAYVAKPLRYQNFLDVVNAALAHSSSCPADDKDARSTDDCSGHGNEGR